MTRKQKRAQDRIARAKERKARNFENFLVKVAKRKTAYPRDLRFGFYNFPPSLGMTREEFMNSGQRLCGGAAVLFERGKLRELLGDRMDLRPCVITLNHVIQNYDEHGYREDF